MKRRAIDAQMGVLRTISEFIEREGHSPTFRQIASERGAALTYVWVCCRALRAKLMVSWEDGTTRTIRITAKGKRILAEMEDKI